MTIKGIAILSGEVDANSTITFSPDSSSYLPVTVSTDENGHFEAVLDSNAKWTGDDHVIGSVELST